MHPLYLILITFCWLVLDAVIGVLRGPAYDARPFWERLPAALLTHLSTRLDRNDRTDGVLVVRGSIVLFLALALVCFTTAVFYMAGQFIHIQELAPGLTLCLGLSGSGWLTCGKQPSVTIQRTLGNAPLVDSDDGTIRRLWIAAILRTLTDSVVVPVALTSVGLWFLVPVWGAVSWINHAHGRDGQRAPFAMVARLPYLPVATIAGFIAALLFAWASLFSPQLNPARIFAMPFRRHNIAPISAGGLPLTTFAFAMDRTLGGPRQHSDGSGIATPWVGPQDATAQLEPPDIAAAKYAFFITIVLGIVILFGTSLFY